MWIWHIHTIPYQKFNSAIHFETVIFLVLIVIWVVLSWAFFYIYIKIYITFYCVQWMVIALYIDRSRSASWLNMCRSFNLYKNQSEKMTSCSSMEVHVQDYFLARCSDTLESPLGVLQHHEDNKTPELCSGLNWWNILVQVQPYSGGREFSSKPLELHYENCFLSMTHTREKKNKKQDISASVVYIFYFKYFWKHLTKVLEMYLICT